MTWDETIKYIRTQPEFRELVEKAYFEEDLPLNVDRFRASEEFAETLRLLKFYAPEAKTILDIGSGNGISAIAFALNGYKVVVSEPDPSNTVGAGAIRILKNTFGLPAIEIFEQFAEDIQFNGKLFDVVYVRQAMHHAYSLNDFVKNLSTLIKPGGFLFTVRDHVIYNEEDKQWFLREHPLQKFYGGENAFTEDQYRAAMANAGLEIKEVLKYYDSVINYFPLSKDEFERFPQQEEERINIRLRKRIGLIGAIPPVQWLYKKRIGFDKSRFLDEARVPGRMYSFIAQKK